MSFVGTELPLFTGALGPALNFGGKCYQPHACMGLHGQEGFCS